MHYLSTSTFKYEEVALGRMFLSGGLIYDDCNYGICFCVLRILTSMIQKMLRSSRKEYQKEFHSLGIAQPNIKDISEDFIGELFKTITNELRKIYPNLIYQNYIKKIKIGEVNLAFIYEIDKILENDQEDLMPCKSLSKNWPGGEPMELFHMQFLMWSRMFLIELKRASISGVQAE